MCSNPLRPRRITFSARSLWKKPCGRGTNRRLQVMNRLDSTGVASFHTPMHPQVAAGQGPRMRSICLPLASESEFMWKSYAVCSERSDSYIPGLTRFCNYGCYIFEVLESVGWAQHSLRCLHPSWRWIRCNIGIIPCSI